MDYLEIAKVCHSAVQAIALHNSDDSIKDWYKAEQWQRDAAIEGVKKHHSYFIRCKNVTPSDAHDEWVYKKIQDGWVYGVEKNGVLKTHPLLVPYHRLPKHEQMKDAVFAAICNAYFEME